MAKDPELSKLLIPDVEQYFDNFILKALRGEFEEQDDVQLFIQSGKDSFGLPLYFRLRGTVRTENLHQKMKTAIGPWSVGATTAHMMLVLICYRYNVRTSITRCGATDFGHYELHLIDRIQNRIQSIFNVLAWPRHTNISYFQGKRDMVSVGIGPLTYNHDYVILSNEPDEGLTGDKRFLAKQMGLKFPILHVGSMEEKKIFNDFLKTNSPSDSSWKKLAKIYRDRADGKHVNFKLPSMLKAYYKTWVKNSEISAKQKGLVSDVGGLLGELFCKRTSDLVQKLPPTNDANGTTNAILNTDSVDDHHGDMSPLEDEEGMDIDNCIFVGTFQNCYMPIQPTEPHNQRCAWFPYCENLKKECGGHRMKGCRFFRHRVQDLEFVEKMKQAKNEIKKDYKKRYMRERRKAQKEARDDMRNKRQRGDNA